MKLGTEVRVAPRLPKDWEAIEAAAARHEWKVLKRELVLKLNDTKLNQAGLGTTFDFEELGFRVLRVLAASNPKGSLETRITGLYYQAAELLRYRHNILPYARRCGEKMQALLASNTSAAWVELASMLRRELNKPAWALEAAAIALKKEPTNAAGFAVKIAAHGDLGNFSSAHHAHLSAIQAHPNNSFLAAAIAKVELREGKLDASLEHALKSFKRQPRTASARQIGNIYRAAGLEGRAKFWFAQASKIETLGSAALTRAHIEGLVKLASLNESPKSHERALAR